MSGACLSVGISHATYYTWRKKFGGNWGDKSIPVGGPLQRGHSKTMLLGRGYDWGSDVSSEGAAMAAVLQDFGIDQDAMLIESKSRNTFENALYGKQIWDREGFTYKSDDGGCPLSPGAF